MTVFTKTLVIDGVHDTPLLELAPWAMEIASFVLGMEGIRVRVDALVDWRANSYVDSRMAPTVDIHVNGAVTARIHGQSSDQRSRAIFILNSITYTWATTDHLSPMESIPPLITAFGNGVGYVVRVDALCGDQGRAVRQLVLPSTLPIQHNNPTVSVGRAERAPTTPLSTARQGVRERVIQLDGASDGRERERTS